MRSAICVGALILIGGMVRVAVAAPGGSSLSQKTFDYSTIDRALVREPAYQTKDPLYALLLFGPEAKLRVWVVLDGSEVYLDRNGDGDLTSEDEKFKNHAACRNIELTDPDGKTRYNVRGMATFVDPMDADETLLHVEIEMKGPLEYRQYGGCKMREEPKSTALVHFHGPLTMLLAPPGGRLTTGTKAEELRAMVGTAINNESRTRISEPGLLVGLRELSPDDPTRIKTLKHLSTVYVRSHNSDDTSAFPKGVAPVVEVEFPPAAPNAEPIKKRYPLDQCRYGAVFLGPILVPEGAGLGNAKVTLSFDAWKEGKVAPAIMELPVVASSPEKVEPASQEARSKK